MLSTAASAQQTEAYPSYIIVTGNAEREVTPDEIYVGITIDESDSRSGKVTVAEQERKMVAELKKLGIDVDKDLQVGDMSGDLKSYVLRRDRVQTQKNYVLKVSDAATLGKVFQSLQAPNSPNGTHFVAEVSPWFERIASSKEHERLFALLPYKTLYLSSVKDRHGVFAFISKDERRDLPLRKQRPSVRAQLKKGQSKKTAAPKKAAAKAKDNDLEV